MTMHLTFKNFLPVIVGVCVVVLAIIPLVVSPEHLSWHRWQAAIIAAAVIAVVALLVQAALQSREDKEREKREQQRDQREQERDGILTDMRNKLSDISQKPVEQQLNIISTLRTRVNEAIASQVANDLPEPRPKSFDWHREWIEMERDFNRMDDRRIYAECGPDNRTGWDTWHILSDLDEAPEIQKTADTQKCKALCDLSRKQAYGQCSDDSGIRRC